MKDLMMGYPYYSCSLPEIFKKIEDEGFVAPSVAFLFHPRGGGRFFCDLYIRARRADDCEEIGENKELDKNFGSYRSYLVKFTNKDHKKNVERCIQYIESLVEKGEINKEMPFCGSYKEEGVFLIRSTLFYEAKKPEEPKEIEPKVKIPRKINMKTDFENYFFPNKAECTPRHFSRRAEELGLMICRDEMPRGENKPLILTLIPFDEDEQKKYKSTSRLIWDLDMHLKIDFSLIKIVRSRKYNLIKVFVKVPSHTRDAYIDFFVKKYVYPSYQ